MNKRKLISGAFLLGCVAMLPAYAEDEPAVGIVGKNNWLFYRFELGDAAADAGLDVSVGLIGRINKQLAARGVTVAVAMVPVKARIYAEHLPDDYKLTEYLSGRYQRIADALKTAQVHVIDLNAPMLNSPKRASDLPLFYRLDTHWTPNGALVAAEAIKAGIEANPALKKAYEATPAEAYKYTPNEGRWTAKARDLVEQLPKDAPTFGPEKVSQGKVTRVNPAKQGLLGDSQAAGITLMGSSYSRDWTAFPDALRYTLQRDLLPVAVGADQGSWIGIEGYLRNDAFQNKPPKLLIWEIPERDMRAPPDYQYREARFKVDSEEWLLRASAWMQPDCKRSAVGVKLVSGGLASGANLKGGGLATGPTKEGDYVDIAFDKPLDNLDYLSARVTLAGSKVIVLDAAGAPGEPRRFALDMPGDDASHAFRMTLPSKGKAGFMKARIYPGKTNGFSLQELQVCRLPEDLAKS